MTTLSAITPDDDVVQAMQMCKRLTYVQKAHISRITATKGIGESDVRADTPRPGGATALLTTVSSSWTRPVSTGGQTPLNAANGGHHRRLDVACMTNSSAST